MRLFKVRTSGSFRFPEFLVLASYIGVLSIAVGKHEPWVDEAQAWLIARDCSLKEMFLHRLHYEGTPGLWHLFLWFLARAHLSYAGMHWATAGVATAAIFIFLRYSPFPTILRVLLPFTFFLQYQFAVVARSYVFFTFTAFALAALFNSRRPRPVAFAIICGLLANSSLFGVCAAFGFFLVYAFQFLKADHGTLISAHRKSGLKTPATSFVLLLLFAVYSALPTPDGAYGPAAKLNGKGHMQQLLSAITFSQDAPTYTQAPRGQANPTEITPELHQSSSIHDRLWQFLVIRKGIPRSELIFRKTVMRAYIFLCVLTFPISNSNLLATLFLSSLLFWLRRRRQIFLLLPYLFVALFCTLISSEPHNIGVLWITLLATLWIAFSAPLVQESDKSYIGLCVLLILVSTVQVMWTIRAVRNDYENNYDAGGMAARFIRGLPAGRHIVAFNPDSSSIQPYFEENIFENQPRSYWLWSKSQDPDFTFDQTMQSKPDVVIVNDVYYGNEQLYNQWIELNKPWTLLHGNISSESMSGYPYASVARFCGRTFIRFGAERQICYVLFEPASHVSSSSSSDDPPQINVR